MPKEGMSWLTDEEREQLPKLLQDAGLIGRELRPQLLDQIHRGWVGALHENPAPLIQILLDIQRLDTEGRLTDGTVPLVLYLGNAARLAGLFGKGEAATSLRTIRDRVASVTQTIPAPKLSISASTKEVVIGTSDFTPIGFLLRGAQLARAVAKIEVQKVFDGKSQWRSANEPLLGTGTGWLLAPGLLLTCHHVLAARGRDDPELTPADWSAQALGTKVRFDYDQAGAPGTLVDVNAVVASDESLDYALLRLAAADSSRSWFDCNPVVPYKAPANIIQHPDGRPKRVVVRNNQVHQANATTVQYFSDTEPGSSGAPVCDDEWRVMALHCGASKSPPNVTYNGRTAFYVNEGTSMQVIWDHLSSDHQLAITEARGSE